MELYIGGYKQGKLKYVLTKYPNKEESIVNDLHIWIKKLLKDGENAEEVVMEFIDKNPECILIWDFPWQLWYNLISLSVMRLATELFQLILLRDDIGKRLAES